MKFDKPSLSLEQQIAQLERRGMQIADRAAATHYLRHISYYRLRAYWLPFEVPAGAEDHSFREGTTFEAVLSLYIFDRELRLLVMDAVERIEVSVRASWAHHLAMTYGAHGYLEPAHYRRNDFYAKNFKSLIDETDRSKDTFVAHYKTKYTTPEHLPIWMAAEIMSFGLLSKWIGNLKGRPDRGAIAKPYGIDEKVLLSLTQHLSYVRNICAHHGRLWNKQFTVTMMIPSFPVALSRAMNPDPVMSRRVYNTLATLAYLLELIAPGSEWRGRVIDHMDSCAHADPYEMGFPQNWRNMVAWRER